MLLTDLRSLFKAGIKEYGGYAYHIEHTNLPYAATRTVADIKKDCPTGLRKMTVIELNHKWTERFTFGCGGDQEHIRVRRNGVLVRIDWDDSFVKDGESVEDAVKRVRSYKHHTVIAPKGKPEAVEIVVSHKVVIVPWAEYAMVEAEREKIKQAEQERIEAMHEIADALGLRTRIEKKGHHNSPPVINGWNFRDRFFRDLPTLTAEDFEDEDEQLRYDRDAADHKLLIESADFSYKGERWRGEGVGTICLYGEFKMDSAHARKIIELLGPEGVKQLQEWSAKH